MPAIDLYYLPGSAPCNSIILTARALGVELNLKKTFLEKGDHLKPEFLKLNPTHTIPTIADGDFSLFESRAICIYLVEKYGKDDKLYPRDVQQRAVVNQRVFFDLGTLYQRFADYYYPQLFAGQPASEEAWKKLVLGLEFLDGFLAGETWAAGKQQTIADFTLAASITAYKVAEVDLSAYKNIERWYAHCQKTVTGFAEVEKNMAEFRAFFDVLKK